ncbi:hypothetical protein K2173_003331 [Erythroxylum novogranatense]|uniref:RING-type E3 ubiquitin transferase n=1 Tax=Erythroxylum novogranatense TaxID=1862640 RepID=A0AAV8S8B7_9ROSI|nr:hypothetical protein K2173_003331 [Erythroxylum novogranatense]
MVLDTVVGIASCVPGSEIISDIIEEMIEIIYSSKNVLVKKESFKELGSYLERIVPILKELNKKDIKGSESLNNVIRILNHEVKDAKDVTTECTKRNKVYLLMNSRTVAKRLEHITREFSRALSLLPLASLGLSSGIADEIVNLCDIMQRVRFKAAVAEEEILDRIDSGIQDWNVDRSYANDLLVRIAETVGISTERASLKKEFEEFKNEIENVRLKKDQAEAIQMDQIIALLARADATSSPSEKEQKYFIKRNSLGSQPLEPLHSFFCPITKDVMVDPVETSSGQTFERSAIEKWLADGNKFCPLTMNPLDPSILRPNRTLRQSIEEWKDRNTMINIASMKSKLTHDDEEEVLHCLKQLDDLCEQRDRHREWIILENYIPILIELLGRNREIRKQVLAILCTLAKDSDDAKERFATVDNSIECIVRSLGRRIDEGKLAAALLLVLSKSNLMRNFIGQARSCILLLVTMSTSDDSQAAAYALELLEILSFSDDYIIQMAKANYFKPLLCRLTQGPEDVKMDMTSTIAELGLTDRNKASLFEGGVLGPLLHLLARDNVEMNMVAIKALRNLSSLPANGLKVIREGAVSRLLDLLFRYNSSYMGLREELTATLEYLAISTVSQEYSPTAISLLESDEDIFKLFNLINLTGPGVQQNILRTFQALCQSPSSSNVITKLIECSAVQVLAQLFENPNVRADAVKLLRFIVKDVDEFAILEHVNLRRMETLHSIIQSSGDMEEITSAMDIISLLPENQQITNWLLDAKVLEVIVSFLNSNRTDPRKKQLVESAVGAICRFTVSTNYAWQKKTAEIGIIPVLVQLLDSGTTLTKKYAAISLGRFSESSMRLSQPIPKRKGFWCFSAPQETCCLIHGGICSVESSFCLIEADAVSPLVRVLQDPHPEACEASLDALLTLIEGEKLESGSNILAQAQAIEPIIRFLSSPSTILQEKSLNALEKIFQLPEFRQKYGPSAHIPLVDLTQRGSRNIRAISARVLAHLNVILPASSFF